MVANLSPSLTDLLIALSCLLALLTCSAGAGSAKAGPRLSDAQLFDAIDLAGKGLEPVAKAVKAGDLAAARKALASYLRSRASVRWHFDPQKPDRGITHSKGAADKTVAGRVRVIGIWHSFEGGDVDWLYNPTVERKELAVNHEWLWQLNRMGFWPGLGRSYWATGDEAYAQTFVEHLRTWARQCPRPTRGSGNVAGSAWRTIESGIRMFGTWPDAYHRFLRSPSFTDDDVCLYVKLCIEHGLHLRRHHRSGGNWLTMEMQGLYTIGVVLPELKEAAAWRRYAIGVLYKELNRQFLPDGAQAELTPGYHQVALSRCTDIPKLAAVVGRTDELPKDYAARAEKAFDFNLFLMTPDWDMPKFNDSWSVNVPRTMETAVKLYPERGDFLWAARRGRAGKPPSRTSHAFPYAGHCAMRSGWERDANALFFDAGPLGLGHVHQDKLNVVVWAYGRQVLFDGGGGQYESSKWRSYDIDTPSHNTILVDGKPQRRGGRDRWREPYVSTKPIELRWQSDAAFDFAAGTYAEGYGNPDHRPVTHVRRVLFVKPHVFIVVDTLTPKDDAEHTVQARWHLDTPNTALDPRTRMVVTIDEGKPSLAVIPLIVVGLDVKTASAQDSPELLGWHSHKTGGKPWNPATTVLHTRKGRGVAHLVTLLLPLKAGAKCPVQSVVAKGPASAEVKLADGRRWIIEASPEPDGVVRFTTCPVEGGKGGRVVIGGDPKWRPEGAR